MTKPVDTVQLYMSKMNKKHYLDRDTEQALFKSMQDNVNNMLKIGLEHKCFFVQMLNLRDSVNRNKDKIMKISKVLQKDAKESELATYRAMFHSLISAVEHEKPYKSIVNKLKLTNSTISSLIQPIKEQFNTYNSNLLELKRALDYVELSFEDAVSFSEECVVNPTLLSGYCNSKQLRVQPAIVKFRTINKLSYLKSDEFQEKYNDTKVFISRIRKLEEDNEATKTILIQSVLPLVISRAKKYIKSDIPLEDLIQEGNIGLIRAIDKFQYELGHRLTTYSTWWIDQGINRSISNKKDVVRIPIHIQDRIKKINDAYFQLAQANKREPTLSEIAEYSEISYSEVVALMTSARIECGLDDALSEGITINDTLVSDEVSPTEHVSKVIANEKLRAALSELDPRHEKLLRLRFGIGETTDHTLEEIGKHFGLTKERIRQIEKKALQKLSMKGAINAIK